MSKKKKMLPPRRVKILSSKYVEESDLIQWTLHFLDDGTDQTYVWPSIDLFTALNIKGKASPEVIHKFCSEIEGKEINFVIDKEPKLPDVSITKKQNEKLNKKLSEHFHTFKNVVEKDI